MFSNKFIFISVFLFLTLIPLVLSTAPTHGTPLLNSSSLLNRTAENLTGHNQSGADADGDNIIFNYRWYKNGTLNASRIINDSSLIVWLPFDGGNTSDYARDNNGTLSNDPVFNASEGVQGAIDLDGNDDQIAVTPAESLTQNITIMIFFKQESSSGNDRLFQAGGTDGSWRSYTPDGTTIFFTLDSITEISTGSGTVNKWTFFTGTYNGTDVSLYIDGIKRNTSNTTNNPGLSGSLRIGTKGLNPSDTMNGIVDEFAIYNRSLSDSEIKQIYDAIKSGYATLNSSQTQKDESWIIEFTPFDHISSGLPSNSSALVITNTPPTISLNNPTDNEHLNTNGSAGKEFNFTFTPTDADIGEGQVVSCSVFINSSGGLVANVSVGSNASVTSGGLVRINLTTPIADNRYVWFANCTDGTDTGNISTRIIFFDADIPDITWNYPALDNSTKLTSNILSLNIQCADTFIERVNMTLAHAGNSTIVKSNLTTNITSSPFVQNDSISLSGQNNGNYTVEMSCADDVSGSPDQPNYHAKKPFFYKTEYADNSSNTNFSMYFEITNPALKEVSLASKDLQINTTEDGKHIRTSWCVNVSPAQKVRHVYVTNNDKKFNIRNISTGHFIIGDKFVHYKEDIAAGYSISVNEVAVNNQSEVHVYLWKESGWDGRQCTSSAVTGGLNVNTETVTFLLAVPPLFTSNNTNNTAPKLSEIIQSNITITEVNSNLSGFVFAWDNGTGTFVNDSFRTLNNNITSATVSVNKTIERTRGITMQWRWHANDSSNNWNVSTTYSLIVANTLPSVASATINNSNPLDIDDIQCNNGSASDADSDTVTLIYGWLNNSVDANINNSILGNGNTSANQLWQCKITPYDGFGNGTTKTSASVTINVSNSAPSINWTNATSSNGINSTSTNPTRNNSYVTFSVQWNDVDSDAITLYICSNDSSSSSGCNAGASWCNSTFNITSQPLQCNYTISGLPNEAYNYSAFVVDNKSAISASTSGAFAVNHPPKIANITYPLNNTYRNISSINITFNSTDDDNGDELTYTLYIDNTTNPISVVYNSTVSNFNLSVLNETTYYLKVLTTDVHGYSSIENTSIFNFTADTIKPNITVTSPSNGSTTSSKTITLNFTSTDTHAGICWFNVTKQASEDIEGAANRTATCDTNQTFTVDLFTSYIINLFTLDLAENINETHIYFTTSESGTSGGGGGGGGGGTSEQVTVITQAVAGCGNNICEETENPRNCGRDCPVNLDALFSGELLETAWFAKTLIYGFLGITIFIFVRRQVFIGKGRNQRSFGSQSYKYSSTIHLRNKIKRMFTNR